MAKSSDDITGNSQADLDSSEIEDVAEEAHLDDAADDNAPDAELQEPASTSADLLDSEVDDGQADDESLEPEAFADEEATEALIERLDEEPAIQTDLTHGENRRSGAGAMLLGGAISAALGFGAATYFNFGGSDQQTEYGTLIEEQSGQIAELERALADLPPPADISSVDTRLGLLSEQVNALTDSVDESFEAFELRLTEVEKRPGADGTLSDTALEAYQRELDALREDMNAQRDNVLSVAAQAEEDLAAARAESQRLEQEALAAARSATARAAINRVAVAVETGAPFEDALSGLSDVPAPLLAASTQGVATNKELVDAFPVAARAALATARSEGLSDDAGGIGGFLRSQFDVRSTVPIEGDGPDAILSRAEAAIEDGRVADALAEVQTLPEVARAEMTDWLSMAQERADVLSALATLTETYN